MEIKVGNMRSPRMGDLSINWSQKWMVCNWLKR